MITLFLPLILLVGAVFRFYQSTAVALWHDEAFSALFLRYSWGEMFFRIGLDVHPPLYYFILRLWSYVAGSSLFSLRLLSILFGVLTIWAGYLFVRSAFRSKILALLSALFLAVNPFQIQYAQEARMYTLGTFLLVLSSYFLVEALNSKKKKHWIWYSLAVAASLYTHYYLVFSILAQGLFLLYAAVKQKKIGILLSAAWAYGLALILYLPWLKTFMEQSRRVQQAFWIPPLDRWSIPGTIWKMSFGGQGINRTVLVVAVIAAAVLAFYFLRKVKTSQKWHILLAVLVPFAGAVFLSLRTNIYLDRYFVFASLYWSILIPAALYHVPHFLPRWILLILLLGGSLFVFFKNWADLDIAGKSGMTAAAKMVNSQALVSDKIYISSSFIFFTFQYYNQTGVKPLLYSTAPFDQIPHFSGTALLNREDLVMNLAKAPKNSGVWLLWTTGFGGSKPQVPANWKQIEERAFEDSPGFKGSIYISRYEVK